MGEKVPWYLWQLAKEFRAFPPSLDVIPVNSNWNAPLLWYLYNKLMTLVWSLIDTHGRKGSITSGIWVASLSKEAKKNQWRYIKLFITLYRQPFWFSKWVTQDGVCPLAFSMLLQLHSYWIATKISILKCFSLSSLEVGFGEKVAV